MDKRDRAAVGSRGIFSFLFLTLGTDLVVLKFAPFPSDQIRRRLQNMHPCLKVAYPGPLLVDSEFQIHESIAPQTFANSSFTKCTSRDAPTLARQDIRTRLLIANSCSS